MINDRISFDQSNGFFEVKFSINQLDGDGGYAGTTAGAITDGTITTQGNLATMINGSTSLINNLNIKQNGKVVYDGNNLLLTTHVKKFELNIQMIMLDLQQLVNISIQIMKIEL